MKMLSLPSFRARALGLLVAVWVCGAGTTVPVHGPDRVLHAQSAWTADNLWLAPPTDPVVPSDVARAAELVGAGRPAEAIALLVRQTGDPDLGGYAQLYLGRAHLALGHEDQALVAARGILERSPGGYLGEAALWLLADASESARKWPDAAQALQALADLKLTNPQQVHVRLGHTAEKLHDETLAINSYAKVFYEWPLTAEAADAESNLTRLGGLVSANLDEMELARGQALYVGRRYAEARKAFQNARGRVTGEARWPIDLKIAQCDYNLKRYPAARDALTAYVARVPAPHPDADYFLLSTL